MRQPTLPGRRPCGHDVPAGGDERALDAALREDGRGFVRREPFGDAAEVELHARLQQTYRPPPFVERELGMADQRARGGEAGTVRQLTLAPCLAP
jgi:hypothetical protein